MISGSELSCFVIIPFKKEYDSIYKAIEKIVKEEGFSCTRADKVVNGIITKDIFDNIFNSTVIIADLNEKNPNVFYELGVAHSAGRKTIMISQDRKIPFDVSLGYVILYDNTIEGSQILDCELRRILRYLLGGGAIDNPVQMSLPQKIEKATEKSEMVNKSTITFQLN